MVQKSGNHQLRLVVYPIICRVLCIPGGAGFLPSTVFHYFHVELVLLYKFRETRKGCKFEWHVNKVSWKRRGSGCAVVEPVLKNYSP